MMKEKLVYIDGDNLPYRVGFSTQRTVYLLDSVGEHCSPVLVTRSKRQVNKYLKHSPDLQVTTLFYVEDFAQALSTLKLTMQGIVKGSGCNAFRVILSDEDNNFRDNLIPDDSPIWEGQKYVGYKMNRSGSEKPHHWRELRDWLLSMPYTEVTVNEEADDRVSREILAGHVGASNDKDLDNTPGWHYNFIKKERYYVSENEAARNFYRQTLMGDVVDNIPGLKGIGPAKAEAILGEALRPEDLERAVVEAYKERLNLSDEEAYDRLTQVGQLLWMSREEGEMWYPLTGYDPHLGCQNWPVCDSEGCGPDKFVGHKG
jgi:hypothetical protein